MRCRLRRWDDLVTQAPATLLAEPLDAPRSAADDWADRVAASFNDIGRSDGFLPLAEEAVTACPTDPSVLLFAATAAVLDQRPERALAFLKRFSKRYKSPFTPLLHALALKQRGQRLAARALLQRHDLLTLRQAGRVFLGGRIRMHWLLREHCYIVEGPLTPVPPGKSEGRPQAKPARGAAKPRGATRSAPAAAAPELPSLPRIEIDIPFTFEVDLTALARASTQAPEPDAYWFAMRERFAHLGLAQGFDELLCLPQLVGIEPLLHQVETARKVLKQFRGRVLLADEVGLGKTIEAGIVLKEYVLRGMAERILVLVPASLVGQWREELETKFGLAFATTHDALLRDDPAAFWKKDRIVASLATARRREHAEILAARQLDLVIVDEAHHLRDRSSQGWKLVDALNKRFLLLLSATPVQNDLIELYNLLTLLKPGIFKTLKEFRTAYMVSGKPRQPANPERLRALMRDAMIRNTRAVVALKLPRRHATTIKVDPAAGEAEAYAEVAAAARRLSASESAGRNRFALHHLLGAAGSSATAMAAALERMAARRPDDPAWTELAARWRTIGPGGKEAALMGLLRRNPQEKKLVFAHSRDTLEHLAGRLRRERMAVACFHGSLSGPEKDAAIADFRDRAMVLLCTQSGGEGRNIQFCNTLINFDVPWNPMAIEQRIGRIDRIGQRREVFVFNLVVRGTLEEQLLALLEEKISMFELVVGEAGVILGNLEDEREFPDLVLDAWLETSDDGRRAAFDALGQRLDEARRQHESAKALDESLFGEDFEAA
jgi:superfamily II DNA or RNA helicase